MKTILAPPLRFTLLTTLFVIPHLSVVLAAGPLTPPGPPAPTMKTLDQIEPRIDLFNAPASAVTTTNASYHYIIIQPGSYYLSGNLAEKRSSKGVAQRGCD